MNARNVIIYATTLVLVVLLVRRYVLVGGPYFEMPETVQDHIWVGEKPSREAILACRRARPYLPPRAEVTLMIPSQAPNFDIGIFLTAVAELPGQYVIAPTLTGTGDSLPDYIITLRESLDHPAYRQLAEFPEGRLYYMAR